jgi:hypothetical protein
LLFLFFVCVNVRLERQSVSLSVEMSV